ncbi:hypothetical protein [Niallia endozanthoxylica]|uniref:Uncharacterized protein n=1 Tax=Niallia endozanthoxylica TaxID=2036016 RepID=A0A5J5HXT8_9BACI|nr:hypothetical protein [Niallia endozanthoxylica]KAA9027618.1 hypothetical protein F4V44_06360 [Niallia endozanthoxylica]
MKEYTSDNLQQIIGELADSVSQLENKTYINDKDIGTTLMALISVLSEKGYITVDEVEKEKKKFLND